MAKMNDICSNIIVTSFLEMSEQRPLVLFGELYNDVLPQNKQNNADRTTLEKR